MNTGMNDANAKKNKAELAPPARLNRYIFMMSAGLTVLIASLGFFFDVYPFSALSVFSKPALPPKFSERIEQIDLSSIAGREETVLFELEPDPATGQVTAESHLDWVSNNKFVRCPPAGAISGNESGGPYIGCRYDTVIASTHNFPGRESGSIPKYASAAPAESISIPEIPASMPAPPPSLPGSPTPAAPTPTQPSTSPAFYWNAHFEEGSCVWPSFISSCKAPAALEAGSNYQLRLSLTTEQLSELLSTSADPKVAQLFAQAETQVKNISVTLNVIPIFSDRRVQPSVSAERRVYPLHINIKGPRSDDSGGQPVLTSTMEDPIKFSIAADAGGCAFVALSIWNNNVTRSLDSLLLPVPIAGNRDAHSCADPRDGQIGLRGGLGALLVEPAESEGNTPSGPRAAIQVFETIYNNVRHTFVVFASSEKWVGGWETHTRLSEAMSDPERFPSLLDQARKRLRTRDNGRFHAYSEVANELAEVLFVATNPKDGDDARKALEQLQKSTANEQAKLTLTARFTQPAAADSIVFFLPLRLLAAAGTKYNIRDFIERQPFPATTTNNPRCIDRWTVLLAEPSPKSNDPLDKMLLAEAGKPEFAARFNLVHNIGTYFSPSTATPASATDNASTPSTNGSTGHAEGLIVMAHHTVKGLTFDHITHFKPAMTTRTFPHGGAAILASCSITNPGNSDGLVDRLQNNGMNTLIASPYAIRTDYAKRLIPKLIEGIAKGYADNQPLTTGEIFQQAVAAAIPEAEDNQTMEHYRQEGLEFVIAGDPGIRLCTTNKETPP